METMETVLWFIEFVEFIEAFEVRLLNVKWKELDISVLNNET
jgi:hypothetical protein